MRHEARSCDRNFVGLFRSSESAHAVAQTRPDNGGHETTVRRRIAGGVVRVDDQTSACGWTLATTFDGVSAVVIEGIAEHRGEWVAVDYAKRNVVLSAATRSALLSELKRLGLPGGVVLCRNSTSRYCPAFVEQTRPPKTAEIASADPAVSSTPHDMPSGRP